MTENVPQDTVVDPGEPENVLTRAEDIELPSDLPNFYAMRALVVSTGADPKRQVLLQEQVDGRVVSEVGGLADTEDEALQFAVKAARDLVNARNDPASYV